MSLITRSALAALALLVGSAGPAAAQPDDDWGVKRDPFDKSVVARYKGILARDPHDGTALARLLDMYRRYRTVDQLVGEYEKALAKKPDDHAVLVVLGRLDKAGGEQARALTRFEAAAKTKPDDAALWIEIGTLHRNAGKLPEARTAFDAALVHTTHKPTKMKALRALADLALSANDVDGARAYFEQYIALEPKNVQLRIELGDALLAAGKHVDAIEAYKDADKLLGSDPARRVEVIARIGQALGEKGDTTAAVAEYRRAIKLVPRGYYLENELTERIIQIYSDKSQLPELLVELEREWPAKSRRHFEWSTLGRLYDQTGSQEKAIAAYKAAVHHSAWELETQRRLIQLLENVGRDDEALAQYEAVVKIAPGEARFRLELAERYWRRLDQKKAMEVLKRLESQYPSDAGILSAIADLYIRWNKEEEAIKAYERLTRIEPDDWDHLVTLGEQHFQQGNKDAAHRTWEKIIQRADTAAAHARLAEVYNDHGSPNTALTHYAIAIKKEPQNPDHYKGQAIVQEGMKAFPDAVKSWEDALRLIPATDRGKRREAQKKLVTIIIRWGQRDSEYRNRWQRDFRKTPPDIEAGYFLVEYYTKKPQDNEPRTTLVKLHELVPTDQDTTLDLVKAYRASRKFDEAIALLLELAKLAPNREREVFNQISEIKTEQRCATCDAEAIEWQNKAVAKTPNDAGGYEKLAERYLSMQNYKEAIVNYEKALALDPHNWKSFFALADLYRNNQELRRAAELYRRVLRTAHTEDIIEKAAKAAIELEESTQTLDELEKVMAPLSFMMSAQKSVYRKQLVELYHRFLIPKIRQLEHGTAEERVAARTQLDRIGTHGVKPLLEALHDDKEQAQQRIAVKVLGYLGNKGAAAPLIKLARKEPPPPDATAGQRRMIGTIGQTLEWQVRVDALVAAGRLGDPAVIEQVTASPSLAAHEEVAMREAAVFTLGRTGDRRALAPLVVALADSRDSVQAMACLGLAQIDDGKAVAAMIQAVGETRRHDHVRAACAYGLGVRKPKAALGALSAALRDNRGETQRLAGWALGQIGDGAATGALLRAYFGRRDGERTELAWAIARTAGGHPGATVAADPAAYPVRGGAAGKLDLSTKIGDLPGTVPEVTLPASVIGAHVDDIVAGVGDALAEHRDVVLGAIADLDGRADGIGLAGLIGDGPLDEKTRTALAKVGAGVAPAIAGHLSDGDAKVRALALSVLAKIDAPDVDAAIGKALADPARLVKRAALRGAVVVVTRRPAAAKTLGPLLASTLATATAGEDRAAAARALADLGGIELPSLIKAATDPWAFVREPVADALGASGAAAAVEPLLALSRDDIPHVRAAAARALGKVPGDPARKRRAELARDPDPTVSAAAKQ